VPDRPASVLLKSFVKAVRLVMILAILFCGWWLVDLYRNLFPSELLPVPTTPAPTEGFAGPAVFATAALADGAWSVGDSGWSLKRVEVVPSDLPRHVEATGDAVPADWPVTPLEAELVALLRTAGATVREQSCVRVYSLMLRKAQVRVVTQPVSGFERVRLVQAVWTAPAGFNVFEMRPAPPSHGDRATPPLLPLPAGVGVVARRWAGDGTLLAEFVGPVPGDAPDPSEWRDAGWTADGTTDADREVGLVTYAKGTHRVQVWKVSPVGGTSYLLLIRAEPGQK
jgi:hypothetical protein